MRIVWFKMFWIFTNNFLLKQVGNHTCPSFFSVSLFPESDKAFVNGRLRINSDGPRYAWINHIGYMKKLLNYYRILLFKL